MYVKLQIQNDTMQAGPQVQATIRFHLKFWVIYTQIINMDLLTVRP